jgi:zinc protease
MLKMKILIVNNRRLLHNCSISYYLVKKYFVMKELQQMLHSILFVVLLAALPGILVAQNLNTPLPVDPDVVTGKLSNGLTYYIRTNHKPEKRVELRLAVKAGSILENDDQQGLAHFMEHMNFNGTKNFPKNDLVSYLQSIGVKFGADLNAYTSFDQTVYILPVPIDKPDNLEKGFQIIEDWAHNALLTDKDIDEERGVVLEESRLGKGADDRMSKKYLPKMAEGTIYANRLPIGKDDIIKNAKYEKTRSFYHDWYRPDLQAVIIVGDIDVATAKSMLEKHFAGLKNPPNERERKYVDAKPRMAPEAMVVTDKEASRTSLEINFPSFKKHPQVTLGDYRYDLEKNLVQQIMSQRLNDPAQGSNPPYPYAFCGLGSFIHGYESFSVYTSFASGGQAKAINAVTAEIEKAKKFGFTESELTLAKKDMMSSIEKFYNEKNTTESRQYVDEYIRAFLNGEDIPGVDNEHKYYADFLPGIKLDELNTLFREWVKNPNTFSLITAPDRSDVKLPSDKELLTMTQAGFSQQVTKEEEKKIASSLMEKKPAPGRVVSQVKEEGLDATTYTLSNGIKVTIKPTDYKSDEILMTGVKKGGTNSYSLADRSNSRFATDVIESMGVGDFTPNDLEKVTAGMTISVGVSMSEINDNVNASSTVKDFESMLQLTNLYLAHPRKDPSLFAAYKEKQVAQLQFMAANPRAAFFDTLVKSMYDMNPLARMVIPKPADFEKINLDRSMEIYNSEFGYADGYHFFIVGNIKPETAIPLIETYLGSIPKSDKPVAFKDNGVRRVKGVKELKIKKGKEKQSFIISVYSGETKYSEDLAFKAQAVAEVLNIKIIEVLREKMGAIYGGGINANVAKDPYEYYSFQLQLPCGPENVDKLIAAANEEIAKMKANGPEAKDVDKVKSQWHEKHVTDLKENKYWAGKMEGVLFWGRDKDRFLNYEDYVQKLTPADIQQTAKMLFDGKNQFTAVLYPES